jgi:hypothetical protein
MRLRRRIKAMGFSKAAQEQKTKGQAPANLPAAVFMPVQQTGQPLETRVRSMFEPRFGHDFSRVRIHADEQAADAARAVGALAYTIGQDITFGAGQYCPHTPVGLHLLAHELAHVVQGAGASEQVPERIAVPQDAPEQEARQASAQIMADPAAAGSLRIHTQAAPIHLWRATADELAQAATYPTAGERSQIQEILNPQQQRAAEQGTAVPPVADPAGFETDMTNLMNSFIDRVLPSAQARQSSAVVLGMPELTALADIAQPAVNRYYGRYLTAAVHSPSEQAARAAYRLGSHIHEVPTVASASTDDTARDWVASRMHQQGAHLLQNYNVVSGGSSARDQGLFNAVRDHIFNDRAADLRTIILFYPGYEGGGEAYIQRYIAPEYALQPEQDVHRRGRWSTLGTTIHEMLHAVAHETFAAAARQVEESGITVEGFAEYFTRPVYEDLTERAITDTSLRTSIEGVAAPYVAPPTRLGYESYVQSVNQLRDILGGNEENLKAAYFLGRIEYLGLGGWNEQEAAARRFPGNTLSVGALLTDSGQGLFRIDYGRVVYGQSGAFQLQLGGMINYLTQGDRLGLGGSVALQYSWPNVYIRGGVDVAASASLTQPFSSSVRLDLLPGVEAGVRIGIVRVGARALLLFPLVGGPVSERTVRLAGGIGLSLDL